MHVCYISQSKCVKTSFGCHVASGLRGMKSGGRTVTEVIADVQVHGEGAGTVLVFMNWV